MAGLASLLHRVWATRNAVSLALLPISLLYCGAMSARRALYRRRILRTRRFPVPVVVVGNITVGGSGKTPLVQWMASHLQSRGLKPGVVMRGYRGDATIWPQIVEPDSDPRQVGDEPVMLASAGVMVAAGPDRPACATLLIERFGVDIIISDDGLQHLALGRDIEIAVVDGVRRLGNGWCLPAGPLRESRARLQSVDAQIANGKPRDGEYTMQVTGETLQRVGRSDHREALAAFSGRRVHAVAGVGNPQRFFDLLVAHGLQVETHAYPDHHGYTSADILFPDDAPVIMTAKDAVKCRDFVTERHWFLPVAAQPGTGFVNWLDRSLEGLTHGQTTA